jgi:hypothetical protein
LHRCNSLFIQARRRRATGNGTLWTTALDIHIFVRALSPAIAGAHRVVMTAPTPAAAANEVARLVAQLGMQPELLRALAGRAAAVADALLWQSAGATAFRDRVHADAVRLRAAADTLDAAMDLLRRYASGVPR